MAGHPGPGQSGSGPPGSGTLRSDREITPAAGRRTRRPDRDAVLAWLAETNGQLAGSETLLDDARAKLHEAILTGKSAGPVEWLFNQLIGTPRTTIVEEIADERVLRAVCRATARIITDEATYRVWWEAVKTALAERE